MIRVATQLAAETRSFARAAVTMKCTIGHGPSAKTIERLVGQVGAELRHQQTRESGGKKVLISAVAVVPCDGGRIRTREANQGPGVHDPAWRETKNASFKPCPPI